MQIFIRHSATIENWINSVCDPASMTEQVFFSHDLQNSSLFLSTEKCEISGDQPTDYKCNRNPTAFQKGSKEKICRLFWNRCSCVAIIRVHTA